MLEVIQLPGQTSVYEYPMAERTVFFYGCMLQWPRPLEEPEKFRLIVPANYRLERGEFAISKYSVKMWCDHIFSRPDFPYPGIAHFWAKKEEELARKCGFPLFVGIGNRAVVFSPRKVGIFHLE